MVFLSSFNQTVSFVGSHMDVVPANPETWDRNPFELTRDVIRYIDFFIFEKKN